MIDAFCHRSCWQDQGLTWHAAYCLVAGASCSDCAITNASLLWPAELPPQQQTLSNNCAHASATSSESCLNTGASLKTLSLVAGDSRAKSGSGGVHSSLVCGGLEWHCSGPQEAWLCPSWYATCCHPCILTKRFSIQRQTVSSSASFPFKDLSCFHALFAARL